MPLSTLLNVFFSYILFIIRIIFRAFRLASN
jgi:hypothetical protein